MKIIRLQAENVKRIRAVEITPNGNLVVIAGRNGQGKSSVLDAIWYALGGGEATKGTKRPIRDGQKRAEVSLDLGDLRVTRSWTADDKSYLTVATQDGAKYGSPQQVLDKLVGRLSFDPLAFAQQPEREQLDTLLGLVDLPIDLAACEAKRAEAFGFRTSVNRTVKNLEAQLAGMPEPAPDLPPEEVSASAILAEYRQAEAKLRANAASRQRLATARVRGQELDRTVADLRDKLAAALGALDDQRSACIELEAEVGALVDPDLDAYQESLQSVEATNAAVRAAKQRALVANELAAAKAESERFTEEIVAIDEAKATAIRDAKMPIEGLGFDDKGVTYRGLPLKQASSAEQLRVSVAMAMALNPQLRVIRITDGSLLDSDNLALIAEMAEAGDFQVWIERVDEGAGVGIHIEDGMVVGAASVSAVGDQ